MSDLIRREDALRGIDRELEAIDHVPQWVFSKLENALQKVPTADRPKGEWIHDAEAYPLGNPYGHYNCDQCGESVPHKTNFCPNCGADMRPKGDDDV